MGGRKISSGEEGSTSRNSKGQQQREKGPPAIQGEKGRKNPFKNGTHRRENKITREVKTAASCSFKGKD